MRQYTLDGIELALKAIEHRKDCKTAAGIIRNMIVTESMRKGKHYQQSNYVHFNEAPKNGECIVITVGTKQTWFNKLMKKVGL